MKSKKIGFTLLTSILVLGVASFLYLTSAPSDTDTDAKAEKKSLPNKDMFSFVKSMQGTHADGAANQTGDTLTIDVELRRMFDYYLAAIGEKNLLEIRLEIEKELDKSLGTQAAMQAKEVLARYLSYKQDLVVLENTPNLAGRSTKAMKLRLQGMQNLRSRYFNQSENTAMFGADDAYDTDAIARFEISEDSTLNEAQKTVKYQALDAAMPNALREEKEAPYKILRLAENVAQLRQQGASDDEIYRMRAANTSPEAAARLAALDVEEDQWKNRIAAYLQERKQLLDIGKTNPSASSLNELQILRDKSFNYIEQKRLAAYE
ncbi:lipase secretion chaperone [Undibacterium parvum]|uniref:Lipase helper protein n=1 Tax=Undibacterium parvum TaxID=401471 RepID=A0A3Q9BRM3_9BURK|nr:lipase secretion chaperone [Undibacterium parvum]AZP12900.1 lipase chaperone [Undibacterium parvum]